MQYGIKQSWKRRTTDVKQRATKKKYFLLRVSAMTVTIKVGSSIRTMMRKSWIVTQMNWLQVCVERFIFFLKFTS